MNKINSIIKDKVEKKELELIPEDATIIGELWVGGLTKLTIYTLIRHNMIVYTLLKTFPKEESAVSFLIIRTPAITKLIAKFIENIANFHKESADLLLMIIQMIVAEGQNDTFKEVFDDVVEQLVQKVKEKQ